MPVNLSTLNESQIQDYLKNNSLKIGVIGLTDNLPDTSKSMTADDYIESGLKYVKKVSSISDIIVLLVFLPICIILVPVSAC